jgi:hypothetical protein
MSTITEQYHLSARATAGRVRTRAVHPRPRQRTELGSGTWSVMGPANRAPGLPLMGAADGGSHAYLMGGPDPDGHTR